MSATMQVSLLKLSQSLYTKYAIIFSVSLALSFPAKKIRLKKFPHQVAYSMYTNEKPLFKFSSAFQLFYNIVCLNKIVSCPPPLKPRDFVLLRSWLDTGLEQMLLSRSIIHKDFPPKKGFVRYVI